MKRAFTLAEVLITLGIIGIVAAITIPTLIQNHQKQVTVNKLKKVYTTLNNALTKAEAEYGDREGWRFDSSDTVDCDGLDVYCKYLRGNLKVIKDVDCDRRTNAKIVLADGTTIAPENYITPLGGMSDIIRVDLNGATGPNKDGHDQFLFVNSIKYGFAPLGFCDQKVSEWGYKYCIAAETGDREQVKQAGCNENSQAYCGALIMLDNWQISKDYPKTKSEHSYW